MTFLDVSHSPGLVAASVLIAVVAGFVGLSLTKDLSKKPIFHRKIAIALAAVALGGGIWSMHFVAMLGLRMPILFYYDAAVTLSSALLAILIVAAALIILHFSDRTWRHVVAAGALIGIGISAMHYIGMSALELCRAVYTPIGVVTSLIVAIALCVAAIWIAYHQRHVRNILLGTICFGFAVVAVHFSAIFATKFVAVDEFSEFGPVISNETLAIGVILASFAILGAFLWVGATYLEDKGAPEQAETETPQPTVSKYGAAVRVPCEKDGGKVFVTSSEVAFVRADGHYTQVYTDEGRMFCAWPITEVVKRLTAAGHVQVHRSYVVNPDKVTSFERRKDSGICSFASDQCPRVPVSRSKLKSVQALLGA